MSKKNQEWARVASNGVDYVVTWEAYDANSTFQIRACRVSGVSPQRNGPVETVTANLDDSYTPRITYNPTSEQYFLVYSAHAANAGRLMTEPRCGDGSVDTGEQCDDGDLDSGDACNSICEVDTAATASPTPRRSTTSIRTRRLPTPTATACPTIRIIDSDGDTISDHDEAGDEDVATPAVDTDSDGTADYRDLDSDGDGISDSDEAGDADAATPPVDTDSDGTPDFRDLDSATTPSLMPPKTAGSRPTPTRATSTVMVSATPATMRAATPRRAAVVTTPEAAGRPRARLPGAFACLLPRRRSANRGC